ncbi:MinD/ParA family ATP-binding protein [Halorussus litoreus]|uniref:MinD/ParA family ATP-binding protein n=1 Tax=Halorussus litoreus TaxID=1710536 RepID=UPI000E25964E|nr:P-loop NTPase [Halorussus litoreus]
MLAIAGGKGGCGKTTTALGLAGALVRQRKAALAADADREMPDLHALAGVARDPGLDAVAAGWPPEMVAATTEVSTPGVRVLPARSRRAARRNYEPKSSTPLTHLREFDGAVLLDCPAGAGPDAVAPLRVADGAVVVTTTEPACLRDAAKTAAMARELGTPVAGAVVSGGIVSSDGDPQQARDVSDGVTDLLDCEVLGAVPDVGDGASAEPLADDRVRAAHDRVLSTLQPKYL